MRGATLRVGSAFRDVMVVVAVAGLVAAVRAPQIVRHSAPGRLAVVDEELAHLRAAVAAYRSQHRGRLPGSRDAADPEHASRAPALDFEKQLTLYTDAAGRTSERRSAVFCLGPYVTQGRLPVNPFTGTRTLVVGGTAPPTPPPAAADRPPPAWTFDLATGSLVAHDSARRVMRR
jgi:hypothetical protein